MKASGMYPGKRDDGKRGSGSNKTRRKQRDYQRHVGNMVRSGQWSYPNGSWGPSQQRSRGKGK